MFLCVCSGIIGCTLGNNRDILRKIWNSIICNFIYVIGSGLLASHSLVLFATHASAKGVNCTVCGSEIACVSKSASASKTAGASKLQVWVILLIRSFVISVY